MSGTLWEGTAVLLGISRRAKANFTAPPQVLELRIGLVAGSDRGMHQLVALGCSTARPPP